MRIGIDVDGVLRDFVGSMVSAYQAILPGQKIKLPVTDYDLWREHIPFSRREDFYKFFNIEYPHLVFGLAETMTPDTVYDFNNLIRWGRCKRRGIEFIITSVQMRENIPITLKWLGERGFQAENVRIVSSVADKVFGLHGIVDDYGEVLATATEIKMPHVIKFKQAWNENAPCTHTIKSLRELQSIL